jgi:hypothetical protein
VHATEKEKVSMESLKKNGPAEVLAQGASELLITQEA